MPSGEAQDGVSKSLEVIVPPGVARRLARLGVNAPLQLHHQALLWAAKVHHAFPHRLLTAEGETLQPEFTQELPGNLFRLGRCLAQLPGAHDLRRAAGH